MSEQNASTSIAVYAKSPEILARFTEVIGSTREANAYISSVLIAVALNDSLQKCTPQSIISSAMRAATMRLSCDPSIKQAYLVPFKGKATLVIGYKGLYDMAIRTNKYRYLNCFPVHEGVEVIEDQMKGIHKLEGFKTSDVVIGYMLSFELLSGFARTFYMTSEEILNHAEKYSKTFHVPGSAWVTEREKMMRKTVLRLGLTQWGYFDPADAQMISFVDDNGSSNGYDLPDPDMITVVPSENEGKSADELVKELGFGPETKKEKTPNRPYSPEEVREHLLKASEGKAGRIVTDPQISLVTGMISTCFAGDKEADDKRHMVLNYLTGTTHIKDVEPGVVLALLDWLKPYKDSGGAYQPDATAIKEARAIYEQSLVDAGQMALL